MSDRQAKKNINRCDDFMLISRHRDVIKIDVRDNDSPNILLDLAVANKPFLDLLKGVIRSADAYTNNQSTDKPSTSRSEEPKDTEQGEVQEAEVLD